MVRPMPPRGRRAARALAAALLVSLAGLAGAAGAADPPAASVPPGGVIRWSGGGAEECGLAGRRWSADGGDCYFAIDLGAAGWLTVSRWRGGVEEQRAISISAYPYPTQRLRVDDKQVHLSRADLERDRRDKAQVAAVWQRGGPRRYRLPLAAPLEALPPGGRFGARRIFNGEARSPHSGADYAAPAGAPVLAAEDGTVALAADHFFSGKSIYLDHGDGLFTMYFHLSRLEVDAGETVRRGQPIGAVGATGRATGPHLHFGVRWRGARVDPALLLAPVEAIPTLR